MPTLKSSVKQNFNLRCAACDKKRISTSAGIFLFLLKQQQPTKATDSRIEPLRLLLNIFCRHQPALVRLHQRVELLLRLGLLPKPPQLLFRLRLRRFRLNRNGIPNFFRRRGFRNVVDRFSRHPFPVLLRIPPVVFLLLKNFPGNFRIFVPDFRSEVRGKVLDGRVTQRADKSRFCFDGVVVHSNVGAVGLVFRLKQQQS